MNFVTPEHVVPQVLEAISVAGPRGPRLPVVYNTSGYNSVESLRLLDGIVDIYVPDFKFWKRAKHPTTPNELVKGFMRCTVRRGRSDSETTDSRGA